MVLDQRRLNIFAVKESFPLPVIQSIYNCLAGNKYFTCLDVMSGYYHLNLTES